MEEKEKEAGSRGRKRRKKRVLVAGKEELSLVEEKGEEGWVCHVEEKAGGVNHHTHPCIVEVSVLPRMNDLSLCYS